MKISEIPINLQKTLLNVIEEKEFERVGDSQSTKVDVRIISTTNRNLQEEVTNGNFREDLFYRLSIVPITIPPLNENAIPISLCWSTIFLRNSKRGRFPSESNQK